MDTPVLYMTRDGSHTLYSPRFGQHYHNPGGALKESTHVYFKTSGLISFLSENRPFTILETGFGTGLNFLLLLYFRHEAGHTAEVLFQSVEAWPAGPDTVASLNYPELLGHPEYRDILISIFSNLSPGKNNEFIFENVTLRITCSTFDRFDPGNINAGYIFHDAFSPEVNPELWTSDVFRRLAGWSAPDAVLTTFCAASRARAAMAHAGWLVARNPGVVGKWEMTIASRNVEKLAGFKRLNELNLARRYEAGEFDGM